MGRNNVIMIINYILIGMVWALFFDWMLRNYGPNENVGIPTKGGWVMHTFAWPLAIILTIRVFIDRNDEE